MENCLIKTVFRHTLFLAHPVPPMGRNCEDSWRECLDVFVLPQSRPLLNLSRNLSSRFFSRGENYDSLIPKPPFYNLVVSLQLFWLTGAIQNLASFYNYQFKKTTERQTKITMRERRDKCLLSSNRKQPSPFLSTSTCIPHTCAVLALPSSVLNLGRKSKHCRPRAREALGLNTFTRHLSHGFTLLDIP